MSFFKNLLLHLLVLISGMGIGGIVAFTHYDRIGLALCGVRLGEVPLAHASLQLQQAVLQFHRALLTQVASRLSLEERRELAAMITVYAQYIEAFFKHELFGYGESNIGAALQLNALLLKTYNAQRYKTAWINAFKAIVHKFDDSMISQFMNRVTKEAEQILRESNHN